MKKYYNVRFNKLFFTLSKYIVAIFESWNIEEKMSKNRLSKPFSRNYLIPENIKLINSKVSILDINLPSG